MPTDHGVRLALRIRTLEELGAKAQDMPALLAYNEPAFDFENLKVPLQLPLPSEPFADAWRSYVQASQAGNVADVLRDKLVQLNFPVREGVSSTDAYRAATRRGIVPDNQSETSQFDFKQPQELRLTLHATAAGELPIITTCAREDFVNLVRALTMRNEPKHVPDSMGAAMIAGLNNWDRVRQYRASWEATRPQNSSASEWKAEFARIVPQKELYQDRLIILSDGPYSHVAANAVGLSEEEWRQKSLRIRCDHECTHYFTRRVLGSMRDNLLDEIIADYMGIVAAAGCYRPDWFLRFMGLEDFPSYRQGGRLENYVGEEPFSPSEFNVMKRLVKAAADNLAEFQRPSQAWNLNDQAATIMTLCSFTLEELAATGAADRMNKKRLEMQFV